jgi:hypothetical protein
MIRCFLFISILLLNCATWQVMYVQGAKERDSFVQDLKKNNVKKIEVKAGSQDIYIIRYKE